MEAESVRKAKLERLRIRKVLKMPDGNTGRGSETF